MIFMASYICIPVNKKSKKKKANSIFTCTIAIWYNYINGGDVNSILRNLLIKGIYFCKSA